MEIWNINPYLIKFICIITIIVFICDAVLNGTVVVNLAVMDTSTNLVFLEWTLGFNGVVAFAVLYMNMW